MRGTSSNKKAKDKQKPEVQLNAICDIERIQMECRREIHGPHHKVRVEKQALEQTDPHLEDLSSQNESTPPPPPTPAPMNKIDEVLLIQPSVDPGDYAQAKTKTQHLIERDIPDNIVNTTHHQAEQVVGH
jgi:hypothetical protein